VTRLTIAAERPSRRQPPPGLVLRYHPHGVSWPADVCHQHRDEVGVLHARLLRSGCNFGCRQCGAGMADADSAGQPRWWRVTLLLGAEESAGQRGQRRKRPKALSKPVPSATRPPLQHFQSEQLNPSPPPLETPSPMTFSQAVGPFCGQPYAVSARCTTALRTASASRSVAPLRLASIAAASPVKNASGACRA
jgi:hypothetical protein